MPKMQAPENCSGASFAGENYEVVGGFVIVPDSAVVALVDHGFLPVADDAELVPAKEARKR